jgi:hypothetical protein
MIFCSLLPAPGSLALVHTSILAAPEPRPLRATCTCDPHVRAAREQITSCTNLPPPPLRCAVRELDPAGKFRDSAPDRWTWAGVDLEGCCGPNGFDTSKKGCTCRVRHSRSAEQCPPPPYYTTR